jgi:hypothetical protein
MVKKLRKEVGLALGKIGVSYRTVFPDDLIEVSVYKNHKWIVVEDDDQVAINAIPSDTGIENSFWEQWIVENNSHVVHRLLFASKPEIPHYGIFEILPSENSLYPQEVYGRKWFAVELNELTAWGFLVLLKNK